MENVSTLSKVVSAVSQSKNSKSQSSSYADIKDPKKRYFAVIQHEKQNQREKVHQKNESIKKEEEKRKKHKLKQEITRRKRELQYLEKEKESGVQESKKAAFQAQIKQEKDKIKKMEEEIKTRTLDQLSKARYKEALQRQKQLNKVINKNKTHANSMRKTHRVIEQDQRQRAIDYKKKTLITQVRQKQESKQKQQYMRNTYKETIIRHGLSERLIDGTKIGPLIVKQNEEEVSAIKLAELQQLKNSQREKIRVEVMNRNRKTAELRGQKALSKMQREREYQEYCREAEQEQKRYNIRRVDAGKKNQLSGVKPMTISQMSLNKKNRTEQEFQQMFLKEKELNAKDKPVGKYTVIQTKMINKVPIQKKIEKYHKRPINYASNQSLIPGLSEGHYSFQSQSSRGRKSISERKRKVKPKEQKKNQLVPSQKGILKDQPATMDHLGKSKMAQTRVDNKPNRPELDYSSSQQDSN